MWTSVWQHLSIGSYVYTDEHATYNRLHANNSPYVHYTVNHSRGEYARLENQADGSQVNVHINTLEGIFRSVRLRFAYRARRTLDRVDLILSEYVYRRSTRDLFEPFRVESNLRSYNPLRSHAPQRSLTPTEGCRSCEATHFGFKWNERAAKPSQLKHAQLIRRVMTRGKQYCHSFELTYASRRAHASPKRMIVAS